MGSWRRVPRDAITQNAWRTFSAKAKFLAGRGVIPEHVRLAYWEAHPTEDVSA